MLHCAWSSWEAVQLGAIATDGEWGELRRSWRKASRAWGVPHLLRNDFYWGSAAYMLHPRGARALLARYRANESLGRRPANGSVVDRTNGSVVDGRTSRWALGTAHARCVQADSCVLYPALQA